MKKKMKKYIYIEAAAEGYTSSSAFLTAGANW